MHNEVMSDYIRKFNTNDEEIYKQMIDNDHALEWMQRNVPYFECPDKAIEETWYFRWWVFRKHIKQTPDGVIFTEFLADVPWAGAFNSINVASGCHIAEARWLREGRKYIDDYINFWFKGSGDIYSYSCWIVMAIYEYCLSTGDFSVALELLYDFVKFYYKVEETNMTRYGLFWSDDDRDAMEMSISGSGLRPTLNSYMYANAFAISKIAAITGDKELSGEFAEKADTLKENINKYLWDDTVNFYKVIPLKNKDCLIEDFSFSNIPAGQNVMEELGYIPWFFGIAGTDKDIAWKYLCDERYFRAEYGPMTAERNHVSAMKPCTTHECLWNGPSWPLATTQTLTGAINVLKSRKPEHLDKTDFMKLMSIYSSSHYRIKENGNKINWIDENLNPDTGEWLSRKILKNLNWPQDKGGYERGKDYNHSGYCDLVIRGICGIDISCENKVCLDPLLPSGLWDYFILDGLPYKNHILTVVYDSTGTRYKKGKGLMLYVDGALAGKSEILKRIEVILDKTVDIIGNTKAGRKLSGARVSL